MGEKRWALKFKLVQGGAECLILKGYSLSEARAIVKRLKAEIKKEGISPISTWILKYGFIMFDETYKVQGYTLMSLSVKDKRKANGPAS